MDTWVFEHGEFSRVPSVGDGDYVNPISFEALWLAADLPAPETRLALGLHVRDGTLRHVMPAIDTRVGSFRNRGLCTVPRAHTWLHIKTALDTLRLAAFVDDEAVAEVFVAECLGHAVDALATSPPAQLASGSHIVHILATDDYLPTPQINSTLRVGLGDFAMTPGTPLGVDSGLLEVRVAEAAPGGDSEFLPDAYRPLFGDL